MFNLPPMPSRDAGGSFSLDNPDDGTPIKEMLSLKGGLLLITEKCTYQVKLADQIDPKRTNPNLPHNVHRKLFDHGTNSELLCNTLLLATVMFRKEFQTKLDIEKAMSLALDALATIASMDQAAKDIKAAENEAIEKATFVKQQARSFALPSLGNVDGNCKAFTQSLLGLTHCMKHLGAGFFRSGNECGRLALEEEDNRYALPKTGVEALFLRENFKFRLTANGCL